MSAFETAASEVHAIARYRLVDAPAIHVADDAGADLLRRLREQRLLGLAVAAIDDGWLGVTDEIGDRVRSEHASSMARCLDLEIRLIELVDRLTEAGIDHRLLKGSALAYTVAGDPSERPFRDLDILVPSSALDTAVELVSRSGASRLHPPLRPDFDRRFGKSVTLRLGDVEVDLHRTLAPGPFGVLVNPSELLVVRETIDIAGRSIATFDATDHLLHACYHAALGQESPALINLRDIVLLAGSGRIDRDRLIDTVRRWQGRPVLARAVALVDQQLDVQLPELASAFPESPGDEDVLAPYLRPGDRFAGLAAATIRVLPMTDRLAYARAVGLPDGMSARARVEDLVGRRRWRSVRND